MVDPLDGKTGTHRRTGEPVIRMNGQWVRMTGVKALEDQNKAQTYARLMQRAEEQYQAARAEGYNPHNPWNAAANLVENTPIIRGLAPVMRTAPADRGRAAERLWQDAQLKAMTGAGQSAPEKIDNPLTYFPQFGDGADEQKFDARQTAYQAALIRSGPHARTLPKYPRRGGVAANAPRKAVDPFPGIREGQVVQQGGVRYRRQGNQMIPVK